MRPAIPLTLKALTAVLAASMLAACGTANRYDTLKALPVDQVMPAAALSELPRPRLGIAFGGGGVAEGAALDQRGHEWPPFITNRTFQHSTNR
ncbi:MAG: hypothetical protein IPN53_17545 [Comamonadaceae bacterium]|nr:hypothetical protein [Comamonadaceae bacterium]